VTVASLESVPVSRARVQVPAYGLWWADVDLQDPEELSGGVTLQLADLTLVGTIVSGGVHAGRASYRIVGGAGGWGAPLVARGYSDDAGVRVGTVVGDAAAEVGETVEGVPEVRLGPHYARAAAPATRVLHDVAPSAWWVGLDGVTRFGAREVVTYDGDATRTRTDPAVGVIELAVETLAGLEPGVEVDEFGPATDVEYRLDAARLTAAVYSSPRATSRRVAALQRLVDALDPRRAYRGLFEFRVVTQSGERLNLQPVRLATGLSDLERVPVRPGMAGLRATVALGSHVLVGFIDADPSRPAVVAFGAPDDPGWAPTDLTLVGDGDAVALASLVDARLGDVKSWVNMHVHTSAAPGSPTTTPTPPLLWPLPTDPETVASDRVLVE
jgi:hypothetical protein